MRSENRTHVQREHRALDLVRGAAHLAELPHRPADGRRLENTAAFAEVRIPTPDAVSLLGGVDQQKEEGERARGDRALAAGTGRLDCLTNGDGQRFEAGVRPLLGSIAHTTDKIVAWQERNSTPSR